ncbi:NADH-quinone oxidoreductase subunit N [uncultured Microbulbifer sp.]|uniref:NADH-quinone oxidoreductase subunit N n=1 Tax=uncultured Microbulbifer sp. TaxID=348147 RepID=UPI0025F978D9|nr:NADH-quinone oxidoreductase subunit N [uncultured Microbulbifer sp.]
MNPSQLLALSPLLILTGGIVLLLLQVAFFRGHRGAVAATLLVLVLAAASCIIVLSTLPATGIAVTGLMQVDRFGLFICLLNILAAAVVTLLGFHYLRARLGDRATITDSRESYPEEFYILLLLALAGGCALVFCNHFASFFLALELMGMAFYPLLAFSVHGDRSPQRDQLLSLESGLKYLLLSALATVTGLFGIALMFAASGSLSFSAGGSGIFPEHMYLGGLVLFLVAALFKLSLVPFHQWTPDVYQGAPTPVTALISTLGKGALVAILLKFFQHLGLYGNDAANLLLAILAATSMLVGNLLALRQTNIKRLLAYSSIAHIGYLFVAFLVGDQAIGNEAVTYYLVAYVVTTLCAFAAVSLAADSTLPHIPGGPLPLHKREKDPFQKAFYRGLLWRSPTLALCFATALLSLAGIPLTLGFVGKFYLFSAGINGQLWWLVAALIIGSALGLYYYLGLLLTLFQREDKSGSGEVGTPPAAAGKVHPGQPELTTPLPIAFSGRLILFLLTILLLLFGIYPQPLINWIIAL